MAIKKYVENDTEYYSVYIVRKSQVIPGLKICREAKRLTSMNAAQRKEKSLLKLAERSLIEKEGEELCWGRIISEWEEAVKNNSVFAKKINQHTLSDYTTLLFKHTAEWLKLPVNKIDLSMGWTTLEKVEREVSISRRKKLRSAIESVFSWGILSGRIKGVNHSPTNGYKSNIKEDEKIPEILNIEEIKILLKSAKALNHDWYPIWATALLTGMRSGELYALTWKKIDFKSQILYVYDNWTSKEGISSTKGGYWRTVPISNDLMTIFKELKLKSKGGYSEKSWKWKTDQKSEKEEYMENQFVLPRFQEWKSGVQAGVLRTFCKGIGVQSVKFHTLRACFATQLIKEAVAPAVLMKICGWKDLKTMQRYIRLAGLEVDGATEVLKVLPEEDVMENVVQIFT